MSQDWFEIKENHPNIRGILLNAMNAHLIVHNLIKGKDGNVSFAKKESTYQKLKESILDLNDLQEEQKEISKKKDDTGIINKIFKPPSRLSELKTQIPAKEKEIDDYANEIMKMPKIQELERQINGMSDKLNLQKDTEIGHFGNWKGSFKDHLINKSYYIETIRSYGSGIFFNLLESIKRLYNSFNYEINHKKNDIELSDNVKNIISYLNSIEKYPERIEELPNLILKLEHELHSGGKGPRRRRGTKKTSRSNRRKSSRRNRRRSRRSRKVSRR